MTYYTSTSPLPPLRGDISGQEIAPGTVILYDEFQYSDKIVRLPSSIIEFLLLLDGTRTAEFLAKHSAQTGRPFSVDQFLEVVNVLEAECFLDSPRFRVLRRDREAEFNRTPVRPAAHAGVSYPSDPAELRAMFDEILSHGAPETNGHGEPVAIVAPHIDFRVGGASYGPVYNALRTSTADTFVIFGVSHQMSYDAFMISRKDFATPLGSVPTDREVIDEFRSRLPFEITENEIAHRNEHSIEFQAVLLKHLFPDRQFRIVPILTGSLHEYVEMGDGNAADDDRLTALYETLAATLADLGRKACFIAGADLCHVGPKFGDEVPASTLLDTIRTSDEETLSHVSRADAEGFLRSIAAIDNRYRICGVAPIYATLRTARPRRGEVLSYDQWDEREQESAVTFAGVALY